MSKIDHAKRNSEDKLRRQKGERVFKPKKATPKQLQLLKKLGVTFQKNINRNTASLKISEMLDKSKNV